MHTRILVTFVVPILEPVLYLSVLLLVGGLAAYLSTMDRVLGIFVLVVLALSCLGWVLLKAIALRHHRRRRHRRSDRERGRRPHTSKSLPLPRSGQSRESESHSSDSSDQGGEGPSGGEPGHRRMRANHRQATALVSDNDRGHEQHWLNAYWRDIQPVSVRSLDMLLAAVGDSARRTLRDSSSLQAALLSALIITLIIMYAHSRGVCGFPMLIFLQGYKVAIRYFWTDLCSLLDTETGRNPRDRFDPLILVERNTR